MRIFRRIHQKLNWKARHYIGFVIGLLAIGYVSSAIYHTYKPIPSGLNYTGKLRHADVQFLSDSTYLDENGVQQQDHQIFKAMLKLIDEARSTIVIDMFLFNSEVGESELKQQKLAQQLTDALIVKRSLYPEIEIKFITDPVNTVYGGVNSELYRQLRQSGIDVIETNLTDLRSSNPMWSGFWYMCCQGVGNQAESGWLPSPLSKEKVTLRSYLSLLNFKANHRKTLVADSPEGWKAIVSSMNVHDGSSRHSNVGLLVKGNTAIDILKTEQAVAHMSQGDISAIIVGEFEAAKDQPQVQLLTEKAIYDATLKLINTAKKNEHIDLAMFYLSERRVIQALIDAKQRGVQLRVLLDPNKDAFGRKKNGIPNRQVAHELNQAGVQVRWCNTQGEQCHSKIIMKSNSADSEIILGSANFTARNLKNYNLETDLRVIGSSKAAVFVDAKNNFNTAWSNLNGRNMSVAYEKYRDESKLKYGLYRLMEWTGWSTF